VEITQKACHEIPCVCQPMAVLVVGHGSVVLGIVVVLGHEIPTRRYDSRTAAQTLVV